MEKEPLKEPYVTPEIESVDVAPGTLVAGGGHGGRGGRGGRGGGGGGCGCGGGGGMCS
jgi:hypothetical protein